MVAQGGRVSRLWAASWVLCQEKGIRRCSLAKQSLAARRLQRPIGRVYSVRRSLASYGQLSAKKLPCRGRDPLRSGSTRELYLTEQDVYRLRTSTLPTDEVYIGHGWGSRVSQGLCGQTPSSVSRGRTVMLLLLEYEDYLDESGLGRAVRKLQGKTLLCECGGDEGCHGTSCGEDWG